MSVKKKLSHHRAHELRAVFEKCSKNALIDLLGDALDLIHGEALEISDEGALVSEGWSPHEAVEFAAPRIRLRGDSEPASWKEGALRRLPRPPFQFLTNYELSKEGIQIAQDAEEGESGGWKFRKSDNDVWSIPYDSYEEAVAAAKG